MSIGFNKPCIAGRELEHILRAVENCQLSGDGPFTEKCSRLLEQYLGAEKILLTHSCTAALEMAALLCDIQPGDEFIVPGYTFVSTANAFVLRGGVPVFADIRQDTLNMDEKHVESLISPRTRAIVPVHYAGVVKKLVKFRLIILRYIPIMRLRWLKKVRDLKLLKYINKL